MDGDKSQASLLKGIPSFVSRKVDPSSLTSKDKRFYQQVEKALASFDSVDEWADYIAFLSRLHKSLQLIEDKKSFHSMPWIPHSSQVANKLALCLSSRLPNGVHQKTLSLYESIFNSLSIETFNDELAVWIPGLFPLLSYCSIQVKPQLIRILKESILSNITQGNLRIMTKPLMLSLLPGLDDENSEIFVDVMNLMDQFKAKLGDDSHFWQCMFLSIISNPEKRLGALYWCNKRLPVISVIKNDSIEQFSEEAHACLTPEPGLLIRAFATSLCPGPNSQNSASDIIVIRGFFDLLLTHLPLDSKVFESLVSQKDKELLIMACCEVTLKKDMSLNRRLWNYFLGPDTDPENSTNEARSKYFETNALEILSKGLLRMVHSLSVKRKIEAFKISLSIIMDKWEISSLITPRLFSPFLETCHAYKENQEMLVSAQAFFDGVESAYIWSYVVNIIVDESEKDLNLLDFVLSSFNFNEEEMITLHVPLAIICLLATPDLSKKKISILESLLTLVPQRAFFPLRQRDIKLNNFVIIDHVKKFYQKSLTDDLPDHPFEQEEISNLILNLLTDLLVRYVSDLEKSFKLCEILAELLYTIPKSSGFEWSIVSLTSAIVSLPRSEFTDDPETLQTNSLSMLGVTKIFSYMSKSLSEVAKAKILRLILTNLWFSIYNTYPENYQVEAVKAIYELESSCSTLHIEAGLLDLLLRIPRVNRVQALSTLWIHSSSMSEGDAILVRPLQVILDDLSAQNLQDSLAVVEFIKSVVKNGTTNRLLKLITNPILNFDLMNSERTEINIDDDLSQLSYYLETLHNVCKTSPKSLREACSNELVVMDSGSKLNLIKSNGWDISTYKSLICSFIAKFFDLKLSQDIIRDEKAMDEYYSCISKCLDLSTFLVTGNESDFVSRFNSLIRSCSYYFTLKTNSYTIELVQTKFLECIFHFLELSENLKINMNLLHVDHDGKDSMLVKFIIQGIASAQTSLLLEGWLTLLTRSLYLFNESVFSVLLTLNDSIIQKIEVCFMKLVNQEKIDPLVDIEASITTLISGLESLLSISHSFLLASAVKYNTDKRNPNNESGFFGNVIQGVFSIESPAIRTTEQNKLYSVLLSFQDAVRVCFKLWEWADKKPLIKSNTLKVGDRSQIYLAHKLKFRARKMLESLMDLEKQEVIETLVNIDGSAQSTIKLLNILDGGRSQVTLPHLLDSISTRCYPQGLDEGRKSAVNIPITEKDLSRFLVSYFESIDNDTISDIWGIIVQFFRDVLSHSNHYKAVLPDCLKLIKIISLKLSTSKVRDSRKNKRELSEIFTKLLSNAVTSKNELSESEKEEETLESTTDNSLAFQDDILDALVVVLKHLETIIEDQERASSSLNIIIANLVTPQLKSKKINEISLKSLAILDLIGKYNPNRTWKSLVTDSFMDVSFFDVSLNKLKLWNPIIMTWISTEKDKMLELSSRITPLISTTPANIFTWNENSEIQNKIQSLKRIAYLILIQPKDFFLNHLDVIFNRIEDSLKSSSPPAYRSEISILLRAITLKFSELHLLPRWIVICHELTSIFNLVIEKNNQDLSSFSGDELDLVLNGSKLLDQLLLLGFDEFNLNEWLFVSSSPEIINGSSKLSIIAAIDRISNEKDLTVLKDLPIKVEQPQEELVPLLKGIKTITSITQLRLFFDYLSLINYERTFGLFEIDFSACEGDVMNDLV